MWSHWGWTGHRRCTGEVWSLQGGLGPDSDGCVLVSRGNRGREGKPRGPEAEEGVTTSQGKARAPPGQASVSLSPGGTGPPPHLWSEALTLCCSRPGRSLAGHWPLGGLRLQSQTRQAPCGPAPVPAPASWVLGFASHAAPSPHAPLPACVSVMSRESRVRSQPVDTGGGGVAASRAGGRLPTVPPSPLLLCPLQTRHPLPPRLAAQHQRAGPCSFCGAFGGHLPASAQAGRLPGPGSAAPVTRPSEPGHRPPPLPEAMALGPWRLSHSCGVPGKDWGAFGGRVPGALWALLAVCPGGAARSRGQG